MSEQPDPYPKSKNASHVGVELPILSSGPILWRSLDELSDAVARPDPHAQVHEVDSYQQLVELSSLGADPSSRREFLRLMAASMAPGWPGRS